MNSEVGAGRSGTGGVWARSSHLGRDRMAERSTSSSSACDSPSSPSSPSPLTIHYHQHQDGLLPQPGRLPRLARSGRRQHQASRIRSRAGRAVLRPRATAGASLPRLSLLLSLPPRPRAARAQQETDREATHSFSALLCCVWFAWVAALCVSRRQKFSMLTASRPCPTPSCRSATGSSLAQRLQPRHGLQQLVTGELWFLARCSCCS